MNAQAANIHRMTITETNELMTNELMTDELMSNKLMNQ